jgi:hypothetical protein
MEIAKHDTKSVNVEDLNASLPLASRKSTFSKYDSIHPARGAIIVYTP